MCQHQPRCPDALAPDRAAARVRASHPEQGWSLLCNGVVLFDDAGVLVPSGQASLRSSTEPDPISIGMRGLWLEPRSWGMHHRPFC